MSSPSSPCHICHKSHSKGRRQAGASEGPQCSPWVWGCPGDTVTWRSLLSPRGLAVDGVTKVMWQKPTGVSQTPVRRQTHFKQRVMANLEHTLVEDARICTFVPSGRWPPITLDRESRHACIHTRTHMQILMHTYTLTNMSICMHTRRTHTYTYIQPGYHFHTLWGWLSLSATLSGNNGQLGTTGTLPKPMSTRTRAG